MKVKLASEFFYRIQQNDDFKSLCKKFNTIETNIIRNNNQIPLYCGEMIKIKTNDYLTHFVKPTETIESISNKYDLSIEKLIRDNGLKNTKLFIGQRIKIYKED